MYIFNSEKIANYLRYIQKNIATTYRWNANLNGLVQLEVISIEELYNLNQQTLYEKEVALKFILEEKLQKLYKTDTDQFEALCMWIIQEWGGIKGAKPHTSIPRVYEFINADKPKYEALPSVSKVGMFMYPRKNIIYDTRVIYALNWAILSQNAGSHFFPIPGGRNSKINAFNMEVLIRLSRAKKYKPEKRSDLNKRNYIDAVDLSFFIEEKEAYYEAIKLIGNINKIIWDDDRTKHPFYTEMLLFSSADTEIFHDITNTVSLSIQNISDS